MAVPAFVPAVSRPVLGSMLALAPPELATDQTTVWMEASAGDTVALICSVCPVYTEVAPPWEATVTLATGMILMVMLMEAEALDTSWDVAVTTTVPLCVPASSRPTLGSMLALAPPKLATDQTTVWIEAFAGDTVALICSVCPAYTEAAPPWEATVTPVT